MHAIRFQGSFRAVGVARLSCRGALVCAALIVWLPGAALGEGSANEASYSLALESITTQNLKHHVGFLADDRQEGREAGSRGGRACGDFVAREMARYHLEPAGDDGYFQPVPFRYRNVLGQLRGSDPRLRFETILVGAHYDHVGRGTSRNSRGRPGEIHNGADDNASGTAGLLELAEAFSLLAEPPRRSILFVAWDAEEKGMLGSQYWARHPTVPLDNLVFAFNMDMIGRLRDNTVYVLGSRSSFGLRRLVAEHNPGFELVFDWTVKPNADHWPTFDRRIPFLMFHTGRHAEYHTQNDDVELIDHESMRRLTRHVFATIHDLANAEKVPGFRAAARHEDNYARRRLTEPASQPAVRLGVQWRESSDGDEGVQLTGVHVGSPAEAARLRPGDRIIQFGPQKVHTGDELRWAVFHAYGPTEITVQRPNEPEVKKITAELPSQRLRVGINWRVDAAAPGTVILTRVIPGSPAARAGLRAGDRVYQVAGEDFADEEEFADRLGRLPGPLELLIERRGRLETVVLNFDAALLERAA